MLLVVAVGAAETAALSALPETLPTAEATAAGKHSADVPTPALVNYDLIKRAVVSLTGLGAVDGSLLRLGLCLRRRGRNQRACGRVPVELACCASINNIC